MHWTGEVAAPSTKNGTTFGVLGPGCLVRLSLQGIPDGKEERVQGIESTADLPSRDSREPLRGLRPIRRVRMGMATAMVHDAWDTIC